MTIGQNGEKAERVVSELGPDELAVLRALRDEGGLDTAGLAGVAGLTVSRARRAAETLERHRLVKWEPESDAGDGVYELNREELKEVKEGVKEVSAQEVEEVSAEASPGAQGLQDDSALEAPSQTTD